MNDEFIKYGKILALDDFSDIRIYSQNDFFVFEKIDGGNCQVRKINGSLVAGSRANFLRGKKLNRFEWFKKLNGWMHSNKSLYNLSEDVVLFGEWAGNHTIDYNQDSSNKFYLIDLFDINSRTFFDYDSAFDYSKEIQLLDVNILNVLHQGVVDKKILEELLNEKSSYYDGPKEGLVLKDYEKNIFLKIYHEDFVEKRKGLDGRMDYLPRARFNKAFFRLLDEREDGVKQEDLINAVYQDVLQEEKAKCSIQKVKQRFEKYYNRGDLPKVREHFGRH